MVNFHTLSRYAATAMNSAGTATKLGLQVSLSGLEWLGDTFVSALTGTTTPVQGPLMPNQQRLPHTLNASWLQKLIRHPIAFSQESVQAGINEARNAVTARYAPIGAGIGAVGESLATLSDVAYKGFISLIVGIPVIGGGILLSSWSQAISVGLSNF